MSKRKSPKMIRIDNLTKKYGTKTAVDGLSLVVPDGSIYGLLGPNGAGKSTTLKMMVGILHPDSGDVSYDDFSILQDTDQAKRTFSYIPDSPDMFLGMKGKTYLAFLSSLFKIPAEVAQERTDAIAKKLEMSEHLDEYIATYSHGMREKIFLIGAMLHDPKALILDEPLTGLDPESAFVVKSLFLEHVMKGNSIVLSTHILDVAEKICTHIGIIDKGRLLFSGTLEELRKLRKEENSSLETLFLELTAK